MRRPAACHAAGECYVPVLDPDLYIGGIEVVVEHEPVTHVFVDRSAAMRIALASPAHIRHGAVSRRYSERGFDSLAIHHVERAVAETA
jgi:hypothetical protein